MSGTQQLILLTLFIIRPVSPDQTDFIRDLTLNREPQNQIKLYAFSTQDSRYILRQEPIT